MTDSQAASSALPITEASRVGEARRTASALARLLGFDETDCGKAALLATEVATNLLKHGRGGLLLLRVGERGPRAALEVLALDKGPGMADVAHCLQDGYSTAGSPGNGLGAIGRLCATFQIDSRPGVGTALLAQLLPGSSPARSAPSPSLEIGAVNVAVAGEQECGDTWAVRQREGRTLLLVADGLGHGPQAAEAALAAVRVFRDRAELGPADTIRAAHDALRSTRGAAIAVAEVDPPRGEVRFAGLGNISGGVFPRDAGRPHSMVSHNGTAGHELRKVQEFTYPWAAGSTLILHSDGVATHWRPDRYPGLLTRHPALIAGILFRDFNRGRDDATVLVARDRQEGTPTG